MTFNTISEILTEPPYDWSTTATGLVFLAALVGNFVGWATGVLGDFIVIRLARRNNGVKEPEMRLWTLCLCAVYAATGYFLYGWGAQNGMSWVTIAFGVGCMIAHQVSACSVATAYAMECFPGVSVLCQHFSRLMLTNCARSPGSSWLFLPFAALASTLPSATASSRS